MIFRVDISQYVIIIINKSTTIREHGGVKLRNEKMVALRGDRSQKQVAKELGIPHSTYAMIESGHRFPRKELQAKLAKYFDVTVDELFFGKNDHETRSKTNTA